MSRNLLEEIVSDDKVVIQTISISGKVRNELAKSAKENGRSLSAEISYRAKQSLKAEGIMV